MGERVLRGRNMIWKTSRAALKASPMVPVPGSMFTAGFTTQVSMAAVNVVMSTDEMLMSIMPCSARSSAARRIPLIGAPFIVWGLRIRP